METPAFAVIGSLLTIGSTGNCFFETGVGEDCFLFVFIFQTYRFEIPSQMANFAVPCAVCVTGRQPRRRCSRKDKPCARSVTKHNQQVVLARACAVTLIQTALYGEQERPSSTTIGSIGTLA